MESDVGKLKNFKCTGSYQGSRGGRRLIFGEETAVAETDGSECHVSEFGPEDVRFDHSRGNFGVGTTRSIDRFP